MENLLQIENLTICFGGLIAVDDVSFGVKKNEILGLIGPNGAGKTTVFNAITGFCPAIQGRVLFKGESIIGLKPHEVAKKGILRTFQRTNIFHEMTTLENVITAADRAFKCGFWRILLNSASVREEERIQRDRALAILAFCGINKHSGSFVKNLSYGDQRLVGIAIALAAGPEVLLLDEPAAGLNPVETQKLMDLITRISHDEKTIVLVEHDMSLVMGISDRIEVLNFGRKIAEGLPKEIAEDAGVIKAYLGTGRQKSGGESVS
jgi:branched-chain amino acid transport system ATP-binding protein